MEIVIVHLSDIHIAGSADSIIHRAAAISGAVNEALVAPSQVVIVVSGDIASTGSAEEYVAAKKLFDELHQLISVEANCDVKFVIAPGNHDCDFRKNGGARDNIITAIGSGGVIDESVIDSCISIQDEFFKFRNEIEDWPSVEDDGLWRSVRTTAGGKNIIFDCLNVSWVSKKKEDQALVFPVSRYAGKEEEQCDIRFVVMHHPLNWYKQGTYKPLRSFVRKISSIVITGHEHAGNIGLINDQESSGSAYLEGAILQNQGGDLSDTGFFIVRINPHAMTFAVRRYEYRKNLYHAAPDDEWSEFRPLPEPSRNSISLSPEFERGLSDPGALSKNLLGGEGVRLTDIFVYPDLLSMGRKSKVRQFFDSKRLANPEHIKGGVLIQSDERAGATSLLNQLFQDYVEKDFVPVLVLGSELRRADANEINQVIAKAASNQYSKASHTRVRQAPRAKKILLLDNFDHSPIRDAAKRAELLATIKKNYDYFVIVVGKGFELSDVLDKDAEGQLASLPHFQLQPFGFAKRAELVKRWVSLGNSGQIDEGDFISRCDKAERLISAAMKKSLIPSVPLYLLALLQSAEGGRNSELKESALGHYYQFLISDSLLAVGVPPSKLTEYFQYATHLAWEFHEKKSKSISYLDLAGFNERFTATWTRVELDPTLKTLVEAKILQPTGNEYEFKHAYMYYHLKGKYISGNLADENVKDYVARCCKHLYVRDNANTILFLAHHTNDDWLLDSITASLSQLFGKWLPVTFDDDTAAINGLISDAPALAYSGGSPQENRAQRDRARDEIDHRREDDGLRDCEESNEALSIAAQMTVLIKTTEILGQVLKNQYSTIKRPKKRDLIAEQFKGPLRAIACFYRELETAPERLVNRIKAAMEHQGDGAAPEERDRAARRQAAELIEGVSFALIANTSQNTNSDDLWEDICKVVEDDGTTAFKLLELGVLLDSAKPLPKQKLETLYEDKKNDVIVSRILKILVLSRLYMFKTSETEMKWVASKLNIPLKQQHLISYQNAGQKIQ